MGETIIKLERPTSFLRTQILMSRFEIALKDSASMQDPKKRLALWEDLHRFILSCVVEPDKDTASELLMDASEAELFGYLNGLTAANDADDAAGDGALGGASPLEPKPADSARG